MEKINFSNGEKISAAKVTIDNVDYEVTPAVYDGATPLNATVFNNMQENIEDAIDAKADSENVYTKQEVDNLIPTKAHQINVGEDEEYKVNLLKTKNLFDKNNVINNYRLASDGTLYGDTGFFTSNYIKVKSNTAYIVNITPADTKRICFYDDTQTFISYASNTQTFTTPNGTAYVRFASLLSGIDVIQLEEGSIATEYTPFINNQINIDNEKFSDTINVGTTEDSRSRVNVLHSKNLLNLQNGTDTDSETSVVRVINNGIITINGTPANTNYNRNIGTFKAIKNGTYTLMPNKSTTNSDIRLIYQINNGSWVNDDVTPLITLSAGDTLSINLRISSTNSISNFVLKPMLNEGNTILDFEPYIVPSIKVDNEEIYNKGLSDYSTNEQKIGTWIDGKPLYRKVILSTIPSGTTSTEINLGVANISHVHRAEVRFNSIGSGDYVFNSYYSSASDYMRFFMRNNTLQIRLGANSSGFNILAIVEYTKTTE